MLFKRKAGRFFREQQVDIASEFPGEVKDLFFRMDVGSRPGVTLRALQNGRLRVHCDQEVAQFWHTGSFLDFSESAWIALQIVVARFASGRLPREFESFVVPAEFDGEVNLHN